MSWQIRRRAAYRQPTKCRQFGSAASTNARLRTREYLTEAEVERLIKAASRNRHGQRDVTLLLVIFRRGLRTSEACALRWADVDLERGNVHVHRVKNGDPSVHPLSGRELRALRRLKREQEPASPFVFTSERGSPFTRDGIAKLVARAGVQAGFDHAVHVHMLRHACGYKLANDGTDTRTIQAYLGHLSIQHTMKYTALAPDRFNRLWHD
jgi:type 1 fimbriae regulatory protein FimB/type 1 fimbriae regulatory protein FimE